MDVADEQSSIGEAWAITQASLPEGWTLDGLRCASSGLAEEERSGDWIALAIGPTGQERAFRGADPVAALAGLAAEFE